MKTYAVTQHLEWCCPKMLVFVDDNGYVIGNQQNPNNDLTQNWVEEGETLEKFDPADYKEVREV
ncbi:MAG TPA: hypothetical protein V6C58_21235 [Allocoleopsis sp.]